MDKGQVSGFGVGVCSDELIAARVLRLFFLRGVCCVVHSVARSRRLRLEDTSERALTRIVPVVGRLMI